MGRMDPEVKSKLEISCRTCGICEPSDELTSLFEPRNDPENQSEILELANFFKLNIAANDGLPQQICKKCFSIFSDIQLFLMDCQAVQTELRVCFQKSETPTTDGALDFQDIEFLDCESVLEPMNNDTVELNDDQHNDTDQSTNIVRSPKNGSTRENSIACNKSLNKIRINDCNMKHDNFDHFSDSDKLRTDDDDDESDNDDDVAYENETKSISNLASNPHKKCIPQCRLCFKVCITEMELEKHKLKCFQIGENRKKCRFCRTVYETCEERDSHLKKYHSNRSEHICSICGVTVKLVTEFRIHLASHSSKCNSCDLEFPNSFRLREHVKKKHTTFECPICKKQFKKAMRYKYHMQSHRPEKKFKCQYCDRTFMQKHHLETHETIHTGLYPYLCNVCGKEFRQYASFKTHLKNHVGEKDAYVCTTCDKSFLVEETYLFHLRSHMNKATYYCTTCNLGFVFKRSLMRHNVSRHNIILDACNDDKLEIIEKTYDYKCALCPVTFKIPQSLATHMITHTEQRPFVCDLCKRCFKHEKHLKIHKESVHMKLKPFRCDQCDRYFGRNYELTVHMKIHSDERPYKCSECDKSFKTKSSYRLHLRIHDGSMPFNCEICGDSFHWHSSLKAHMNRQHTNGQLDSVHSQIISRVCKIVGDT